jgi:hypothetical protein
VRPRQARRLLRPPRRPPRPRPGADHPNEVWETTHVSGHRYAANLVILPHALYYGPVGPGSAKAAVDAYQRGEIAPARFRGRAGQPFDEQLTRHRAMTATGTYALTALD